VGGWSRVAGLSDKSAPDGWGPPCEKPRLLEEALTRLHLRGNAGRAGSAGGHGESGGTSSGIRRVRAGAVFSRIWPRFAQHPVRAGALGGLPLGGARRGVEAEPLAHRSISTLFRALEGVQIAKGRARLPFGLYPLQGTRRGTDRQRRDAKRDARGTRIGREAPAEGTMRRRVPSRGRPRPNRVAAPDGPCAGGHWTDTRGVIW